jgi:hypothetical protein
MPKHLPIVACRFLVLSIFAALLLSSAARAGDKGVGVRLSVTTLFPCADADMSTAEGVCKKVADGDSVVVGSVNVTAIACKSPADMAGLKLADVIVSINGVTVNGLSEDAYEDLLDLATSGNASWVVLRKSFGHWEKKELMLLPAEIGDDFSCGKPDSETLLHDGQKRAAGAG